MTGCGINDDDVLALSEGLKVNTTLTSLNLGGKQFCSKGINKRIETRVQLSSTDNEITNEGITALCQALCINTSLIELDMKSGKVAMK